MNPILLMLIAAFALATLYFISTLVRRRHARPAPRRGKHALGKPAEGTVPASTTVARQASEQPSEPGDDAPTDPALPIVKAADRSTSPSDLFEQHYAAKFARLHKRAEQLRARVQET